MNCVMKHLNIPHLTLALVLLTALNSCQTTGVKYPEVSPIFGLAQPIHLTVEETPVTLIDYFSQRPEIDSFQTHESITWRYDTSAYTCYLSANKSSKLPKLTTLKVFISGVPYSILVRMHSLSLAKSVVLPMDTEQHANKSWIKLVDIKKHSIQVKTAEETYILAFWENFELAPRKVEDGLYEIPIPPFAKRNRRSYIRIYGATDQTEAPDLLIPLVKGKVVQDPRKLNRQDFQTNIVYFVMIDRFVNGKPENDAPLSDSSLVQEANFMGGDIKGITMKIQDGYFDSLGVNTLLISPVTQNPKDAWSLSASPDIKSSGYHGYWPVSSSQIERRFGDEKELQELLDAAHAHNMNVLLDYVPGYVHQDHSVYQLHPEWATSKGPRDSSMNAMSLTENKPSAWLAPYLPTLNLKDQLVTRAMADSALYWLKKFHFDGFGHYASEQVPPNYWRTLNTKIKNDLSIPQSRKVFQMKRSLHKHHLYTYTMDNDHLSAHANTYFYDVAVQALALPNGDMTKIADALNMNLHLFGFHNLMGNMSGNPDKQRIIKKADETSIKSSTDKDLELRYKDLKLLNALNMTIPGVPMLFYGDEFGLPGVGDPHHHKMMYFDLSKQEQEVFASVQSLTRTRRSSMALLYGDFSIVEATKDILVFKRSYFRESVYVVINKGQDPYVKDVNGQPFFTCGPMDYHIKFVYQDQ
jgi:cyclomaltodextrinase